ncbi:MAG: N-acetylmuramoyl-L-alanine amidase-like domain-containing protein, partial [Bacteroidota bacterium]
MKRLLLFCASITCLVPAFAQLYCSDESMQRLQREITHLQAQDFSGLSQGEIMTIIGKDFLGTPYVGKTLEIEGEPLVVNLTGLDCTTFLENAVVLSRLSHQGRLDQQAFYEELQNLRYRAGDRNGYLSRLHYFSDWIVENERKGLITQVSEELGGSPWQREINFMTEHADLYEYLEGEEMVEELAAVEERLSATGFHYLPKEELADLEDGIQDGDLIAITTSVNGLDISHVGFAIRV